MVDLRDKIRSLNLVEIAKSYGMDLKENQNRHKAKCPFHSEKTPSFIIFTNGKHRFHCFGCGIHGDAVDFVAQYNGVSNTEAMKILGILEQSSDDQKKYYKDRKQAIKDFNSRIENTKDCLNSMIKIWHEKAKKNPWNSLAWHYFNYWQWWLSRMIIGSDDEKYDLVQKLTVKKLAGQAREVGIL